MHGKKIIDYGLFMHLKTYESIFDVVLGDETSFFYSLYAKGQMLAATYVGFVRHTRRQVDPYNRRFSVTRFLLHFLTLSTDISGSGTASLSSAPKFLKEHCVLEVSHASPACPSGKDMLVGDDEYGLILNR